MTNDIAGMDELYRDFILDHYRNPRNAGTLDQPDATFEDNNPLCGDKIRMDLRIRDGVLEDVVSAANPIKATVTGDFTPRGGLSTVVTATWNRAQRRARRGKR